ncbi:MAG: hypothetical protein ACK5NI_01275 [bacterium]
MEAVTAKLETHKWFRITTKILMGLKWGEAEEDKFLIKLQACLQNK